MSTARFSLSSDQAELLLAFEECKSLARLAEALGRDPSVVSRGLQRLAEDFPVLTKVKGRWEITPLGRKANDQTREFIGRQRDLFSSVEKKSDPPKIVVTPTTVLLVINAQQGLLDATQPGRNNSEAEKNIAALLKHWRTQRRPVVHVKHVSENPGSFFARNSKGSDFLPEVTPMDSEDIVEKSKSSGFSGTQLEAVLQRIEATQLVLVGFTANDCIDATARDASSLGFSTYVVGDATAMFDLKSPEGKLLKAERLHRLTLANISAFSASVIATNDITSL